MTRMLKKKPFRAWLDAQPRAKLTYTKNIPDPRTKGWTVEDFIRESTKRGCAVRISTAFKWACGTKPRWFQGDALAVKFPGIRF